MVTEHLVWRVQQPERFTKSANIAIVILAVVACAYLERLLACIPDREIYNSADQEN